MCPVCALVNPVVMALAVTNACLTRAPVIWDLADKTVKQVIIKINVNQSFKRHFDDLNNTCQHLILVIYKIYNLFSDLNECESSSCINGTCLDAINNLCVCVNRVTPVYCVIKVKNPYRHLLSVKTTNNHRILICNTPTTAVIRS